MVLVVVCQLVIHEYRVIQRLWYCELDCASALARKVCLRRVALELPLGSYGGRRRVPRDVIRVVIAWDIPKSVVWRSKLALRIVDSEFADLV